MPKHFTPRIAATHPKPRKKPNKLAWPRTKAPRKKPHQAKPNARKPHQGGRGRVRRQE